MLLQGRRRLNLFDSVVEGAMSIMGMKDKKRSQYLDDPDSQRTIEEVIEARGFKFEHH